MPKVRQNCKWIKHSPEANYISGKVYPDHDHPDLLRALRALSKYDDWVNEKLIPIACKWIDENRERVIDGMSSEEMNDMGAAIEKAYQLITEDGFIASSENAESVVGLNENNINPLWQKETEAQINQEN